MTFEAWPSGHARKYGCKSTTRTKLSSRIEDRACGSAQHRIRSRLADIVIPVEPEQAAAAASPGAGECRRHHIRPVGAEPA